MAGTDDAVAGAGAAEARDSTDAELAAALAALSIHGEKARRTLADPGASDDERGVAHLVAAADAMGHWIVEVERWADEVKKKHHALCVQVDGLIKDVGALEGRVLSLEESR